jgi:hypothetical protein
MRAILTATRAVGDQPVEGLGRFFPDNKEFPGDERFRQSFVNFSLCQSDYGRYVLEMLERAQNHKAPADLSEAQIDHVMPQTLSDGWEADLVSEFEQIHLEWLHTSGNLTLSAYNPALYNHPFRIKREEYDRINVTITRQLASYPSWSKTNSDPRRL